MRLVMSSVVRRHLRDADAYVDAREMAPPVQFDIESNEELLGWYRNPPPWERAYALFTTIAICVYDGNGWIRIPFDEIMHYEMPESKADSSGVRVRTRAGIAFIRFAGRSGPAEKFSDAYALVGLLRAVVLANQRKERS